MQSKLPYQCDICRNHYEAYPSEYGQLRVRCETCCKRFPYAPHMAFNDEGEYIGRRGIPNPSFIEETRQVLEACRNADHLQPVDSARLDRYRYKNDRLFKDDDDKQKFISFGIMAAVIAGLMITIFVFVNSQDEPTGDGIRGNSCGYWDDHDGWSYDLCPMDLYPADYEGW